MTLAFLSLLSCFVDPSFCEGLPGADLKLDDVVSCITEGLVAPVKWVVLTHYTDEVSKT